MTADRTIRDARLADLTKGALRAGDTPAGLAIRRERALWLAEDWTTTDETVLSVGLDTLWHDPSAATEASTDPLRKTLGWTDPATTAVIDAITAFPRDPSQRAGFEAAVRAATGRREATYRRVVVGAYRRWLLEDPATRRYPFTDVGVLLPLRLETYFFRKGDGWAVKLRVIPQPPSVDAHDPRIDPDPALASADDEARLGEPAAAAAFWRAVGRTGRMRRAWFDRPAVRDAFAQLARAVGPARAAWIATSTRGVRDGDLFVAAPLEAADPVASQRVVGLPPTLTVRAWRYIGGDEVDVIDWRLPNDPDHPDATISPLIDVELFASVEEAETSWLTNWTAAVEAGLAGEFDLPAHTLPEHLGGIEVVGLGDERPAGLLNGQLLSGALTPVSLGAATNSVDGAPTATSVGAADGAPDLEDWRTAVLARLEARQDAVAAGIGRYLGAPDLPAFARPSSVVDREIAESIADDPMPATGLARLFTRALWPVLWGGVMTTAWPQAAQGHLAALTSWALENVSPEGDLPALGFGSQPYGVLPITALGEWQPRPEDGPTVAILAQALATMRRDLHVTLRPRGSMSGPDGVGVDEARFTELLGRGGVSRRFQRELQQRASALSPNDPERALWERLGDGLRDWFGALGLPFDPQQDDYWLPTGPRPMSVALELVAPPRYPVWWREDVMYRLPIPRLIDLYSGRSDRIEMYVPATTVQDLFHRDNGRSEFHEIGEAKGHVSELPDSLLIRLLAQAVVWAKTWPHALPELSEPVEKHIDATQRIAEFLGEGDPRPWDGERGIPASTAPNFLGTIADFPFEMDPGVRKRFERAFAATIDTVTTRIDPWVTSFAWQRLRASVDGPAAHHRLGAYGWVHGPFRGEPGPTPSGLLHTPSLAQTVTATILRDRYTESVDGDYRTDDGGHPWDMELTSTSVRLATEIATDIRAGNHLFDVLGREVERIVEGPTSPDAGSPYLRIERLRKKYRQHDDRESVVVVCHGVDALHGLLDGLGDPADADFPLSDDQAGELRDLRRARDALADLLVIDGLTHSVGRETHRAAAVMEANAGLGRVPELSFPDTSPSGFQIESTVLAAIPAAAAAPGHTAGQLADPSVAAFLVAQLGTDWAWTVHADDGPDRIVGLTELGLAPVHTLAWSATQLARLAAATAGLDPTTARVDSPPELQRADELCALLGSPATERTFARPGVPDPGDAAAFEQLRTRYAAVHRALTAAYKAASAAGNLPASGEAQQRAAIREAARWGVTPDAAPPDAATFHAAMRDRDAPAGATSIRDLVRAAAAVLRARLDGAPKPAALPKTAAMAGPLPDPLATRAEGVPDGVASLAALLSALTAPQGRLPILIEWDTGRLQQVTELAADPAADLDVDWLTVVAPVRPALARLEAVQLQGAGLSSWSNSPADPWLTDAVEKNLEARAVRGAQALGIPRFRAAYGPSEAFAGPRVAVGVLDAFTEAVPMIDRSTHAAFGFNAPAARAPQAILLAVPPVDGRRLDDTAILGMLRETRELLVARTATSEEFGHFDAVSRNIWLPNTESVDLLDAAAYPIDHP